ncbi:MAG: sulfur carrier protein ThiS [Kiritimatiellae bacterium]|nr:sulfur carrier protein ThiS [Kiritimatiellia bacterium]
MLRINGKEQDVAGQALADYLSSVGYNAARVVVEINEAIVPRDRYAGTILRDGDVVEIVCFMGGG